MSARLPSGRLLQWLRDRAPVPLAAPERPELRQARRRIIVALCLLALLCADWSSFARSHPHGSLAAVAGIGVFLMLQIPLWVQAKARADDAWLLRERGDDGELDA